MIWYRGDDGDGSNGAGRWYAADREYAEFYGSVIALDDAGLRVLDLTAMGVGGGWDDDETYAPEVYDRVERLAKKLARRYDAVRVMQWHHDYSSAPQDTLLILR
jgi:hypothetical protein